MDKNTLSRFDSNTLEKIICDPNFDSKKMKCSLVDFLEELKNYQVLKTYYDRTQSSYTFREKLKI